MGGNAFPGLTKRLSANEFYELENTVIAKLMNDGAVWCVETIPAYLEKESFGDLDLLIVPSENFSREKLQSIFNCGENISCNGGVWSLVYNGFQVDLIKTTFDEIEYARNYFSWNDRGNLVGRYAHKFGLKHGHDGLWLPVRSADHILGNVLLTLDPREAEEFLAVKFGREFCTLEDMFLNVACSTFFNPDIFLLENRNHTARTRDRKRASYTKFLEWCEVYKSENPFRLYYEFSEKSSYLEAIFEAFPHAKVEYDRLMEEKRLLEAAAEKFNGNLVREWTGLDGVELGKAMKELKVFMTKETVTLLPDWAVKSLVTEFVKRGL
jgi:hypothetical protein